MTETHWIICIENRNESYTVYVNDRADVTVPTLDEAVSHLTMMADNLWGTEDMEMPPEAKPPPEAK